MTAFSPSSRLSHNNAAQVTRRHRAEGRRSSSNNDAECQTRIQDAPGPAQTSAIVRRNSGNRPSNSSNNDVRIQDAPGPAQNQPASQPNRSSSSSHQTPPQTTPPQS